MMPGRTGPAVRIIYVICAFHRGKEGFNGIGTLGLVICVIEYTLNETSYNPPPPPPPPPLPPPRRTLVRDSCAKSKLSMCKILCFRKALSTQGIVKQNEETTLMILSFVICIRRIRQSLLRRWRPLIWVCTKFSLTHSKRSVDVL